MICLRVFFFDLSLKPFNFSAENPLKSGFLWVLKAEIFTKKRLF